MIDRAQQSSGPGSGKPNKPVSANRRVPADGKILSEQADELADVLLSRFMTLLRAKVTERNGHLSAADLDQMGNEFRDSMDNIKEIFLEAVESCARSKEQSRMEAERGNLFTRLMVHKFEHRFVSERQLFQNPQALSRRILPGFMTALYTMVGTQKQEEFERRAEEMAKNMRARGTDDLDWAEVYRTSAARMIALGAEIEMAQHFREAEKRLDWLQAIINANLISVDENFPGADWQFSREAAVRMLRDIFSDLRATLDHQPTRQKIRNKLGPDVIKVLDDVTTRFN